eukprot:jgi/Mesvir1/8823/Mv02724-RA.1
MGEDPIRDDVSTLAPRALPGDRTKHTTSHTGSNWGTLGLPSKLAKNNRPSNEPLKEQSVARVAGPRNERTTSNRDAGILHDGMQEPSHAQGSLGNVHGDASRHTGGAAMWSQELLPWMEEERQADDDVAADEGMKGQASEHLDSQASGEHREGQASDDFQVLKGQANEGQASDYFEVLKGQAHAVFGSLGEFATRGKGGGRPRGHWGEVEANGFEEGGRRGSLLGPFLEGSESRGGREEETGAQGDMYGGHGEGEGIGGFQSSRALAKRIVEDVDLDNGSEDGEVNHDSDNGKGTRGGGSAYEGGKETGKGEGGGEAFSQEGEQGDAAELPVEAHGVAVTVQAAMSQAQQGSDAASLDMDTSMQGLARRLCGPGFQYPTDNLFVMAANQKRVRPRDSVRLTQLLPRQPPQVSFNTCALVANSGILKSTRFGASIDRHDVVLRVNQAPTQGYERYVGSRTTFRLLNKKWAAMYTSKADGRGVLLPTEHANATLVLTRVTAAVFQHLASVVRRERPDMKVLLLAQGVETQARLMLEAFRKAMDDLGFSYQGGTAPSSGFLGLFLLLQMCRRVAVYGLSLETSSSRRESLHPYHYFTHYVDSVRLRAHPHHSFLMEGDLVLGLAGARCLTLCMPRVEPRQYYDLQMRWALPLVSEAASVASRGCGA